MQQFPRYPHNLLAVSSKVTLAEDLSTGQLAKVEAHLQKHPAELLDLIALLAEPEVAMQVRIGISAVLETLAGQPMLVALIPGLGELTRNPSEPIRSDACYFLGLTGHPKALPYLKAACSDEHSEVRAAAEEALDDLQSSD